MTKELPDPFTRHACERLRSLAKLSNDAEKKKAAATKSRDTLIDEIDQLNDGEKKKAAELKADCYDEERTIERCSKIIKTCESKMKETIAEGDNQHLFETQASRLTLRTLFSEEQDLDDDAHPDDQPAGIAS